MNACIVATPITSEDDRWISIVNWILNHLTSVILLGCLLDEICVFLWFRSINAFYPIAETRMPKLFSSVIVCWKRCNIHKRGINTLPHYIHWTSASMAIKRKTPYGAFKMEPWTVLNQKYGRRKTAVTWQTCEFFISSGKIHGFWFFSLSL